MPTETNIDLQTDNRSQDIVANVIDTLSRVRADGNRVFDSVVETQDVDSFVRVDDILKGPKNCDAAVIEGVADRQAGSDNSEIAVVRLTVNVIVRFNNQRGPGETKASAMNTIRRLTDIVRRALLIDKSRGGLTNLVTFAGTVLDGTDVRGATRVASRGPNEAFTSFVIPVVCGYSVFS